MRIALLAAALAASLAVPALAADLAFPPGATAREAALLPKLTPKARAFVKNQAKAQVQMGTPVTPASAAQALGTRLEGLDINSLIFLVSMQTARDADADMRAAMGEVDAADSRKQTPRDDKKPPVQLSTQGVRSPGGGGAPANAGTVAGRPGSPGQMTQADQVRLQRSMERMSKAMEMISDSMKKASDTQGSTAGNLK